ncbi:Olfactory receptor 1F12 [Plecturocebus cupreus]
MYFIIMSLRSSSRALPSISWGTRSCSVTQGLECSGTISAHCNSCLRVSSDCPASAFRWLTPVIPALCVTKAGGSLKARSLRPALTILQDPVSTKQVKKSAGYRDSSPYRPSMCMADTYSSRRADCLSLSMTKAVLSLLKSMLNKVINNLFKTQTWLDTVARTYNPSTLGGRGGWIMRSRDRDHPGQHGETPSLLKIQKLAEHGDEGSDSYFPGKMTHRVPLSDMNRNPVQEVGDLGSTPGLLPFTRLECSGTISLHSTATSTSWVEVILVPQPPKQVGLQVHAIMPGWFFLRWCFALVAYAGVQSRLTATSVSWVQAVLLPQPPESSTAKTKQTLKPLAQKQGFTMLARLVLNFSPQVICPPRHHNGLGLQARATVSDLSWDFATLARLVLDSRPEVIHPPQPPKVLGLQA